MHFCLKEAALILDNTPLQNLESSPASSHTHADRASWPNAQVILTLRRVKLTQHNIQAE